MKAHIRFLRQVFPDLTCTIKGLLATGNMVWAWACDSGTHRGSFMGKPATGKVVTIDIVDICRFENGKIVEHWASLIG